MTAPSPASVSRTTSPPGSASRCASRAEASTTHPAAVLVTGRLAGCGLTAGKEQPAVREDAQSLAYVRRTEAGFEVGVQPIGAYEGELTVD